MVRDVPSCGEAALPLDAIWSEMCSQWPLERDTTYESKREE